MRLSRAIGVLAAGAAAAWAVDRRRRTGPALLPQATARDEELSEPEPPPAEPPPKAPEPDLERPEPVRAEPKQPTIEQPPLQEPAGVDLHAVVDDLIAPPGGEAIVDAEVVEEAEPPREEQLAASVRRTLAKDPHIPAGAVSVEVAGGSVYLRGEIDSPGLIGELERRVQDIDGVEQVRNLLHLPGTPSPG